MDFDVCAGAVSCGVPRADDEEVATVGQQGRVPVGAWEQPEPVDPVAGSVTVEACLRGEVLHRPGRVVLCRCEGWLGEREEYGAAVDDAAGARFDEKESDAVRVVRCGELRDLAKPADERLWVADARTDVD